MIASEMRVCRALHGCPCYALATWQAVHVSVSAMRA